MLSMRYVLVLQEAWQIGGTSSGQIGKAPPGHLASSSPSQTSAGCIALRGYPS